MNFSRKPSLHSANMNNNNWQDAYLKGITDQLARAKKFREHEEWVIKNAPKSEFVKVDIRKPVKIERPPKSFEEFMMEIHPPKNDSSGFKRLVRFLIAFSAGMICAAIISSAKAQENRYHGNSYNNNPYVANPAQDSIRYELQAQQRRQEDAQRQQSFIDQQRSNRQEQIRRQQQRILQDQQHQVQTIKFQQYRF